MLLLERLAEEKIQEAIERGDLNDLPGMGEPIPQEEGMELVPADLRMGYRILKNSGFVPEEVRLRREIADINDLLQRCEDHNAASRQLRARFRLLNQKLSMLDGDNLVLQDYYYRKVLSTLNGKTE